MLCALLVIGLAVTPDFSISLEHPSLVLIQGQDAANAITVNRLDGFDGDLSLSVSGAPGGAEASMEDNKLNLKLSRYAHVGDHRLTVRAVSGETARTADLKLRVLQSQPVSAGHKHNLAIKPDGTLWSWGENTRGQLGLGDKNPRNAPVQVGTDTDWLTVTAAYHHSLALKKDGSLWVAGAGIGAGDAFARVGSDNYWVAISSGENHSMAIKADRSLWVWGRNRYGEIGNGTTANQAAPAKLDGNDWAMAAGGTDHTIALKTDGSIWTWGSNGYGQLGLGNRENMRTPQRVGSANDWKHVAAAHAQCIAIKTDGSMWGWGHNISGQLGLGNNAHQNSPQRLDSASDWIAAATGTGFTVALRAGGSLNASGSQHGTGQASNTNTWSRVQGAGWVFVSTGGAHTLAVGPGGALVSWGLNSDGQLGHGSTATAGNGPIPGFTVRQP